jgi:hypothetical protein
MVLFSKQYLGVQIKYSAMDRMYSAHACMSNMKGEGTGSHARYVRRRQDNINLDLRGNM